MNNDNDNIKKPQQDAEAEIPEVHENDPASVHTDLPKKISFGEWMRTQREAKSITLEEIASVTKIQLGMLKSIESDDYSKLPATAFIRGFVLNFAKFVGSSEVEVLERFKEQLKKSNSQNAAGTYFSQNNLPNESTENSIQGPAKELSKGSLGKGYNRPSAAMDMDSTPFFTPKKVIALITVVIVISLTTILFKIGSEKLDGEPSTQPLLSSESTSTSETIPLESQAPPSESSQAAIPAENLDSTKTTKTEASVPTPPIATPTAAKTETTTSPVPETAPSTFAYHLKLKALDGSWINVRVDQKNSQGTMFEKGQVKDYYGNQNIVVALSDAGSVEFFWNGKWYQPAGFRGDVKSLNFPADLSKLKEK